MQLMFVKVITRPGPEIYDGLCPEALVLPDSFGIGAGGVRWLGRAGPLSRFTFFIHFIRCIVKQKNHLAVGGRPYHAILSLTLALRCPR